MDKADIDELQTGRSGGDRFGERSHKLDKNQCQNSKRSSSKSMPIKTSDESDELFILERIPIGIAKMDRDGEMLYQNSAFKEIFFPNGEQEVQSLESLATSFPVFKTLQTTMESAIVDNQSHKEHLVVDRLDGKPLFIDLTLTKVSQHRDQVRFLLIVDDVTQRVAKESALREKGIAEAANQAKTEFLTNISHEIRTPLTAINGFVELIDNDDQNINFGNIVQALKKNTRHLLILVNDLLDLTKIESGQLEIELSKFSLYREVESVLQTFIPMVIEKPVTLEVRFEGLVPKHIVSDQLKFRQILINLINNSIKYTQKGFIRLNISVEVGDKMGIGTVIVELVDSGCGISEKLKDQLFLPFTRGFDNDVRIQSGLGVGLALSRKMAQSLGGDITLVSSTKGKGSKFRFSLPVGNFKDTIYFKPENLNSLTPIEPNQKKGKSLQLRGVSVLVVDDVEEIRFLAETILTRHGARVDKAVNGIDALKKMRKNSYDLIFLDLQMPKMDGMTVMKIFRSEGYNDKVVALTAHAFKSERDSCLTNGFDNFLSKPFSGQSLLNKALEELAREEGRDFVQPFAWSGAELPQNKNIKKALEIFYSNLKKTLNEMDKIVTSENHQELGRLAHRLKGSAGCYGYDLIAEFCLNIENLKDEKGEYDWKQVAEWIEKIRLQSKVVKFDLNTR